MNARTSVVLVYSDDEGAIFHLRQAPSRLPLCGAYERKGMLVVRFNVEATGAKVCPDCALEQPEE